MINRNMYEFIMVREKINLLGLSSFYFFLIFLNEQGISNTWIPYAY
jgi:hypothetical protein